MLVPGSVGATPQSIQERDWTAEHVTGPDSVPETILDAFEEDLEPQTRWLLVVSGSQGQGATVETDFPQRESGAQFSNPRQVPLPPHPHGHPVELNRDDMDNLATENDEGRMCSESGVEGVHEELLVGDEVPPVRPSAAMMREGFGQLDEIQAARLFVGVCATVFVGIIPDLSQDCS